MRRFSMIALLLAPSLAFPAILDTKVGTKVVHEVKLAEEATVQVDGKTTTLKPYAAGIRKKKVALFWANVYVAQIFSTPGLKTPPATVAEGAQTLADQPVVAVTLTFVRDVDTKKLISGFEDSLQKNDIDPADPTVKPLLDMVAKGGDVKEKSTTTIVFEQKKDGAEAIRFENSKGEVQSADFAAGTRKKVMLMWFGKPADSGMERLQKQFLGKAE